MYPMYYNNNIYSAGNCYCPHPGGAMISKCPYSKGSTSGNTATIEVAPTNRDYSNKCGGGFSESEARASHNFQVPKTGMYIITSVIPETGVAGSPISFDIYHDIGLGKVDKQIQRVSLYTQSPICLKQSSTFNPYNYYIGTPSNAEGKFYVTFTLQQAVDCYHPY